MPIFSVRLVSQYLCSALVRRFMKATWIELLYHFHFQLGDIYLTTLIVSLLSLAFKWTRAAQILWAIHNKFYCFRLRFFRANTFQCLFFALFATWTNKNSLRASLKAIPSKQKPHTHKHTQISLILYIISSTWPCQCHRRHHYFWQKNFAFILFMVSNYIRRTAHDLSEYGNKKKHH